MERGSSWVNLNGLWEFQAATPNQVPPFGQKLADEILVPFPVEACLSGIGITMKYLLYRTTFDAFSSGLTILRFGAVDWQTTVYVNGVNVGNHTGGYDGFSFDITDNVKAQNNELFLYVFDPSNDGFQPEGKQRISAIVAPGGDTYTPSSGIWQTVWLENVPTEYISDLKILPTLTAVTVTVSTLPTSGTPLTIFILSEGTPQVFQGVSGTPITMQVRNPIAWHPDNPHLYNFNVTLQTGDSVMSYFGLRTITLGQVETGKSPGVPAQTGVDRPGLDFPHMPVPISSVEACEQLCATTTGCQAWAYCAAGCDCAQQSCWLKSAVPTGTLNGCRTSGVMPQPGGMVTRPLLNGNFTFFVGWLDQSWWPDGQYTAPSDAALKSDLLAVKSFGMNAVRLHQKVNSERWYYWADTLGIAVMQDMIQKYGGATAATVPAFDTDLRAMIAGRYNHPCILQWDVFNEEDCVGVFNATATVEMVQQLDPSRLVDTNSGGPANNLHIADVNDYHTYPWPGAPLPSNTQYAMLGEYGGIGAFVTGHEWVPHMCTTYLPVATPQDEATTYTDMVADILGKRTTLSAVYYTQITDVERECDGLLNYDRTNKFTPTQAASIAAMNQALINS